jgi:hypothetical protein
MNLFKNFTDVPDISVTHYLKIKGNDTLVDCYYIKIINMNRYLVM